MKRNSLHIGSRFDRQPSMIVVPPEGGWGYMVCLGLSVMFISCTAHLPVFGFVYNDFLEQLGEGTSAVTLVHGVNSITTSCAGFIANIALKTFTLRQVGLFGSILYFLGTFFSIFVTSVPQLIFTNGFVQGAGFGLMIPVAYTSFNSYFTKQRVLYLSFCKACIGLGTMIYPLFIKYSKEEFGFRGTVAMISAIGAQAIFGMAVMQPVEWHMKIQEIEENVTAQISETGDENITTNQDAKLVLINENMVSIKNNEESFRFLRKDHLNSLLATENRRFSSPIENLDKNIEEKGVFDFTDKTYIENVYRAVSMSSLGNFGVTPAEPLGPIKNKSGKWETVVEFLDLNLLKDNVYNNIAFGMALAFFADLTFFTLEPLLLYTYNFTNAQIATCISVGGACDMAARMALGVSGQFFKIKSRYIFYTGAILAAAFRIVFIHVTSFEYVLILTGLLGASRSLIHIPMPLVIAEYLPIERYPAAYGLYMLIQGFINITVGPAVGILRDWSGSYVLAFNLLTTCNLLCIVPWTIEAVITWRANKNKV